MGEDTGPKLLQVESEGDNFKKKHGFQENISRDREQS